MKNPISLAVRTLGKMMLLTVILPATLSAQSLWLDRSHDKTITLEVLKPTFKRDDNGFSTRSMSGWIVLMSSRWRVSENTYFVSEIPFATGEREIEFTRFNSHERETGSVIGNPYFGLESGKPNSPFFTEFGVRLPLLSEDDEGGRRIGRSVGENSDFSRPEAFLPEMLTFTLMMNYRYQNAPGPFIRLRGGPSLFIYTGEDGFDLTLPIIGYGLQGGYESERFRAGVGYTGRTYLIPGFGTLISHQLSFNASVGLGRIRPGIHFRMPLDKESKEDLDYVLGLDLGIYL